MENKTITEKLLVSVIIPTKNSAAVIGRCITSITNQTYNNLEVIVVDNYSADGTTDIAQQTGASIIQYGPERNSQRNKGLQESRGEYIVMIDSDMELPPELVQEAVQVFEKHPSIGSLIIPEKSVGKGVIARIRAFERSQYLFQPFIESPRIFRRNILEELSGYQEKLVIGEDYDLRIRTKRLTTIGRIQTRILHYEDILSLRDIWKKKVYYGRHIGKYFKAQKESRPLQTVLRQYVLFLRPQAFLLHPVLSVGAIALKTFDFTALATGYCLSTIWKRN